MSTTYLATLLLLSLTTPPVQSWNLQNYGFPNHYYISSLAIFRQRAFLTLPRSSCFNANTTTPSLIELPWSGETTNKIPRTKVWLLNIKKQTWGVCRELQDAISVDVDAKKGRLWVLDRGNGYCDGKIVGFNLIFNYENGASLLNGVSNGDLAVLVVDPASHAQRIFVGGLEGEVIVFFTNTMKWQRVKLDGGLVLTDSLAVSRNKAALFITSTKSDDLFSLHLKDLETLLDKQENATTISMNVTYHGQKMGPSGGVTADFKHGLIYYLKRDYAVVRWDTRKSLQAEHHRILYQSYKYFPYVSHLFTGPQMGIWALVNPSAPQTCDANNTSLFNLPEDLPQVKNRVLKLLRFNQRSNSL